MNKFFKQLIDDNNHINEKSFIGIVAFCCMILALLVDIVTGAMGKELVIHQFIFEGFMVIVLGAFGIGSIDKFINARKCKKDEETNE